MQQRTGRMDAPSTPPRALGRDAVDMLAEIPLFSELSRRHIAKVASCASTKRFASGAPLVRVGESATVFYVVLDGEVRVQVPGRPVVLGAGDFFGEMALIDGEPRSATVVAVGEVYVLMLPRAKFLKVLEAEPKIALAIMATLTGRLRALQAATL
ncbi:MAG: family transcriptional regulator, cyclic receptor protein [Gaiellales bacterium]|nr:family transcriptional regulator, cyclic receptor protein [Gaiellales bacterium]